MKKLLNKIISFIALFAIIFFQIAAPLQVLAQDASPAPTEQATPSDASAPVPSPDPTPVPSSTPDVTTEPSPTPSPTTTPQPSPDIQVTLQPTPSQATDSASSTPTPSDQTNNTSPSSSPEGLPNAPPSSTPSPSVSPTPTPSVTTQPTETGHLSATVIDNSTISGLQLDLSPSNQSSSAILTTDKPDYAPTETAIISGSGLHPDTTYILIVTSEDAPAVHFEASVTTNTLGNFIYTYQLDGTYRPNYKVELKNSSGTIVATTTFTDAAPTTRTWDGSSSTDWSTGANWDCNCVPASGDTAIIPIDLTNYPNISSGTKTIDTLTINAGGSVTVSGGTLDFTADSSNAGTITVSSGTMTSSGDKKLTNTGTLSVSSTGIFGASADNTKLTNNGTFNLSGSGTSRIKDFKGTGTTNASGATLQISHDWAPSTGWVFNGTGGTVVFTADAGGGADFSTGTNQFFNLTVNSGVDPGFDNSTSSSILVAGDFTNNNTGLNVGTNATFTFNGTGAQTVTSASTGSNTTFGNLIIDKATGTVTLASNAKVKGNTTLSTGTLDLAGFLVDRTAAGGTLTVSNGATLKIGGTNSFPTNYTTHTLGTSSAVEYSGTTQIVSAETYGHLKTSNSGTKTLAGAITVNGDLTIGAVTTLDVSASNFGITLKGNWTNSGIFTQRSGTVTMNGTGAQTMSGSTFNNLTINNAAGVTLLTDETVNGTLRLTSGKITTGDNTMIIGSSGSISGASSARYIVGNLQMNIPTGDPAALTYHIGTASAYTPLIIDVNGSAGTAGGLKATTVGSSHGNIGTSGLDTSKDIERYWTLTPNGAVLSGRTYDLTLTFLSGDVPGGANTSNFVIRRFSSSTWNTTTNGTRTGTTTQATGITSFSDFAIGEVAPGHIIVDKVTDPSGDPQSFSFDAVGGSYADFSLTDAAAPNDQTLVAGNYSVSETVPAGWNQTSATCVSSIQDNESPGAIELDEGETVTCTFTNTKKPKLTVIKITDPTNDTGKFSLSINGTQYATDINNGGTTNAQSANIGANTFTEAAGTGTNLSDYTSVVSGTGCGGTTTAGTITLAAGGNKTCTITNTKKGHIVIVKDAITNNAQDFTFQNNFGNGNPGTFQLDDDSGAIGGNNTLSTTRDSEVIPGSYSVSEDTVAGWKQGSQTCTGNGNTPGNITVGPGETITCTFVNKKLATIVLVKNTVGGDGTFDFTMTGTTLPSSTQLTTSGGTTQQTFNDIDPDNTYTIEETPVPAGWDLTDTTCTGTNQVVGSITPSNGEVITCTFTNTKKGGLIVQKTTVPSEDQTVFTINASGNGTITNGGAGTVTDSTDKNYEVTPGTYSVAETVPSGWDKTGDTCQNVVIAAGQTVTCLLTNVKHGHIIVDKVTDPSGDTQSFHFPTAGTGYNPFDLTDQDDPNDQELVPGTYTVGEVVPAGWDLTKVECIYGDQSVGEAIPNGKQIELDAGDTVTCTFTNTKLGEIHGMKFNDLNGNGIKDQNEPGLSDWTINLFDGVATTSAVTMSDDPDTEDVDETGMYWFTNLPVGTYTVTEVKQNGWTQTTSNPQDVSVTSGTNQTGIDFGNFEDVIITVFKWEDKNGDGIWQKDQTNPEPPIENWPVKFEKVIQEDPIETELLSLELTGADGSIRLPVHGPGQIRVTEQGKDGWQRTYPIDSFFDVFAEISGEGINQGFPGGKSNKNIVDVVQPVPLEFGNHQLAVISSEASQDISQTSAVVTWSTDKPSTSRVIYDTVSHPVLGAAPNYRYAFSTPEQNLNPKVTDHSVTVSGLTSGSTYYYRTISKASPEAVGDEKSFVTTNPAAAPGGGGGGGGGGGDGGDGLGCATHDCSGGGGNPAPQNLVLGVSTPAPTAGFAPRVLGVKTQEATPSGEIKGTATESTRPAASIKPQGQTNTSPFNAKTIAIIVIALLLGFGIFRLLVK